MYQARHSHICPLLAHKTLWQRHSLGTHGYIFNTCHWLLYIAVYVKICTVFTIHIHVCIYSISVPVISTTHFNCSHGNIFLWETPSLPFFLSHMNLQTVNSGKSNNDLQWLKQQWTKRLSWTGMTALLIIHVTKIMEHLFSKYLGTLLYSQTIPFCN